MPNLPQLTKQLVNKISVADLREVIRGRPGLILGPSWCYGKGTLVDLVSRLQGSLALTGDYPQAITAAIKAGSTDVAIAKRAVAEYFERPFLSKAQRAATIRWAAVLSFCIDSRFDQVMRSELASKPLNDTTTVLADFNKTLPPRTVPIFKMLGSIERDDYVVTSADYRIRKNSWAVAAKAFSDRVKASPVVCLGVDDSDWALTDLIAALVAHQTTSPSILVGLEDEGVMLSESLLEVALSRTRVVIVDGPASSLLSAADKGIADAQHVLPFVDGDDPLATVVAKTPQLIAYVNSQLSVPAKAEEHNRLLELLFSPSVPAWEPFVAGLDFRRQQEKSLLDDLRTLAAAVSSDASAAAVIRGAAASGKSTFVKRLALELASHGERVFWLRPAFFQDSSRLLGESIRALATIWPQNTAKRIVIIMDDPLAFGALSPADVVTQVEAAGLRLLLLVAVRTSEWTAARDKAAFTGELPFPVELDLDDSLSESEWIGLPRYLAGIGVYSSTEQAKAALGARRPAGHDVLSTLYWHLPSTRHRISHSIRDEYFRLGDMAGLTRVVIGSYHAGSDILRSAYEMVAVADAYRSPLPVEVLVGALGVDYYDWLTAAGEKGPAWGLLYPEQFDDSGGAAYRPRNHVVTEILRELLNGGRLAHAGEVKVLEKLLGACTGTQPVYREFCTRVLVPSDKLALVEYGEGVQLYDRALEALPLPDRTLLHHKALYVKNRGRDPISARAILRQALETPPYPYGAKSEADQHIYTSLAAVEVDALEMGLERPDVALRSASDALDHAQSNTFFNPSAVHVEANLILATNKSAAMPIADFLAMTNRAMARIDRTLMVLRSEPVTPTFIVKDVEMLEASRERISSALPDREDLLVEAERVWRERRRQDGFVAVARNLYRAAMQSDKGTDFNDAFSYASLQMAVVRESGESVSGRLSEVALQIYYQWRVVRVTTGTGGPGDVDWQTVVDLSQAALASSEVQQEILYRYTLAVAEYHRGNIPLAASLFAEQRRSPVPPRTLYAPRDYLLTSEGRKKLVQGTIREGAGAKFIYVEEFKTDFKADRYSSWTKDGEITHAFLRFAFGGPVAVKR